jgi:hypothetical protein
MLAETESAITKVDAAADTAMTTIECATTATVVARCETASVYGRRCI